MNTPDRLAYACAGDEHGIVTAKEGPLPDLGDQVGLGLSLGPLGSRALMV